MRYQVRHITKYEYASVVSLSHNQVKLSPRVLEHQLVNWPSLKVFPEPTFQRAWVDSFGNRTHFFSIEQAHNEMDVVAESTVDRRSPEPINGDHCDWSEIVRSVRHPKTVLDVEAAEFTYDSRYAPAHPEIAAYAMPSFKSGKSVHEVALDLTQRIYRDFKYDASATQISTPTLDVLANRRGVCQDFAHLQIACFRSLGLAARYVSGYLLTHPPAGQPKLIGSDASHAWVSVYLGDGQWLDLDPTNNLVPGDEHITIGWGRDYADVSPIQGVLIGTGQSLLKVSVDVTPIDKDAAP